MPHILGSSPVTLGIPLVTVTAMLQLFVGRLRNLLVIPRFLKMLGCGSTLNPKPYKTDIVEGSSGAMQDLEVGIQDCARPNMSP